MSANTVIVAGLAQVSTCVDKQAVIKDRNILTPAAKCQKEAFTRSYPSDLREMAVG